LALDFVVGNLGIRNRKGFLRFLLVLYFSPATVLRVMGLMPGQIPSVSRKRSVLSLSQFLEEFRAKLGGSQKAFPPADCKAHAWEHRVGS